MYVYLCLHAYLAAISLTAEVPLPVVGGQVFVLVFHHSLLLWAAFFLIFFVITWVFPCPLGFPAIFTLASRRAFSMIVALSIAAWAPCLRSLETRGFSLTVFINPSDHRGAQDFTRLKFARRRVSEHISPPPLRYFSSM